MTLRNSRALRSPWQGLLPFTATSVCDLEPALVLPTPGDASWLFLPVWSDVHGVLSTLGGAAISIFEAGLRAWGLAECDSLAEGTFGGTSFLRRVTETEEVAGEGLWEKE